MIELVLCLLFLLPISTLVLMGFLPGIKNNLNGLISLTRITPFVALIASAIGAIIVYQNGLFESELLGGYELGFSIRLDALSITMFTMVSIIGFVVFRFSYNYLHGDPNHTKFIGRLALTVGLVQLLILSGNIFMIFLTWFFTSLALNKLIVFYAERKKARIAARKKFIVARLGDLFLLMALGLIYTEFGSGNLSVIFNAIKELKFSSSTGTLEVAAIFLVLTAGLKSAQIPFHGWLIEVMEAPTPVSALLHAGLLNAGPFLMIRFAYLLDATTSAPILLFLLGSLTALFGALVFITQPAVKTGLAYSSVAHMGFTLMLCGLGFYSASLLHLVAHSFYKAHAFLSSGSVIDKVRAKAASTFARQGNMLRIVIGFVVALTVVLLVAAIFGLNATSEFQLLIISGVIFLGVLSLIVNAFDSTNSVAAIVRIIGASFLIMVSFYGLEEAMRFLLGNEIPLLKEPSVALKSLSSVMLFLFFTTILIHLFSPLFSKKDSLKHFGVHLRNGFYMNVILDRFTGSISNKK